MHEKSGYERSSAEEEFDPRCPAPAAPDDNVCSNNRPDKTSSARQQHKSEEMVADPRDGPKKGVNTKSAVGNPLDCTGQRSAIDPAATTNDADPNTPVKSLVTNTDAMLCENPVPMINNPNAGVESTYTHFLPKISLHGAISGPPMANPRMKIA